jgi:hypothetical protein
MSSINKQQARPAKLENLNKFITFLEAKLNQTSDLFDFVKNEENMNASIDNEILSQHLSAVHFLQSAFTVFGFYFMHSSQPFNSELIRIIPQVKKSLALV